MANILFYLIAALILLVDQIFSHVVSSSMITSQSIPLIKNFLHITYVANTGAAFGVFPGNQQSLAVIGIIFVCLLIYLIGTLRSKDALLKLSLAFIIGGSLGNLADRIFRGYVVDFIDFRFFPVFNLADMMINAGVFLIIIKMLFMNRSKAGPPARTGG